MPPSILNAIEGGGQCLAIINSAESVCVECLHCRSVSLRRYNPVQVHRVWSQSRCVTIGTPPTLLVKYVHQWYGCLKRSTRQFADLANIWDLAGFRNLPGLLSNFILGLMEEDLSVSNTSPLEGSTLWSFSEGEGGVFLVVKNNLTFLGFSQSGEDVYADFRIFFVGPSSLIFENQ